MVKDPVCGMNVDPNTANFETEFDGERYYFCSESCMKAFNTNPTNYLEGGQAVSHADQQSSMGGCCGGGKRNSWMRHIYILIMLFYIITFILR